ncbi:MAG: hypothetical protein ACSHXH_02810 [Marivita sp.]|uniref:hypothetical protein n=1 Tax=Marivita sp. TaxID=2003365 RepID=UPI003EF408A0
MITELNQWISENQALVISFGIPAFTVFVSGWAAFLNHRSKIADANLQANLAVHEIQRKSFERVQENLAKTLQVFHYFVEINIKAKNKMTERVYDGEMVTEFFRATDEVEMNILSEDKIAADFKMAVDNFLAELGQETISSANQEVCIQLRNACRQVLQTEWQAMNNRLTKK